MTAWRPAVRAKQKLLLLLLLLSLLLLLLSLLLLLLLLLWLPWLLLRKKAKRLKRHISKVDGALIPQQHYWLSLGRCCFSGTCVHLQLISLRRIMDLDCPIYREQQLSNAASAHSQHYIHPLAISCCPLF
jgi:hypothetical protein